MPDAPTNESPVARMLPELTDANRAFWTGGADGRLLIQFCGACDRWVHPPIGACPDCSGDLEARPVSGRGTIFTFTVNHQPFNPSVPTPYNVAIVVLDEQDDLRLVTNVVGCADDDLEVGMPVRVTFEPHGDHHVPLFEPT